MVEAPAAPTFERDRFTRTLRRIAARSAADPVCEVRWSDRFLQERYEAVVRVRRLWAVGSWARGAPRCGDLDLVAEVEPVAGERHADSAAVARAIRRGHKHVDVHVGRPEENATRIRFGNAALIWSPEAPDFEAAIAAVAIDPMAGHHPRPTDRLPIPLQRLRFYALEAARALVDAIEAGRIASTFVPLEALVPARDDWSSELRRLEERLLRYAGIATRSVFPHALEWIHRAYGDDCRAEPLGDRATDCQIGPVRVRVGRPWIDTGVLDELSTSALVLVPHRASRGPNGVWVLTRGAEHPLVRAVEGLTLWSNYLVEYCADGHKPWTQALELFGREADAWAAGAEDSADFVEAGQSPLEPTELTSRTLLEVLTAADLLDLDGELVPVTRRGARYLARQEGLMPHDVRPVDALDAVERLRALAARSA